MDLVPILKLQVEQVGSKFSYSFVPPLAMDVLCATWKSKGVIFRRQHEHPPLNVDPMFFPHVIILFTRFMSGIILKIHTSSVEVTIIPN